MKICPKCGAKENDDSKFCLYCGIPMEEVPADKPAASKPVNPMQQNAASVPITPVKQKAASVPVKPAQQKAASVPIKPAQQKAASVPITPVQQDAGSVPVIPLNEIDANIPSGPAQGSPAAFVPLSQAVSQESTGKNGGNEKKKKTSVGKILVAVLVVILLGTIAFLLLRLMGSSSKAVELNECVDVSFAGYEGDGQVLYYINPNSLKKQVEKARGESVETSEIEHMQGMIGVEITLKSKAPSKKEETADGEAEDEAAEEPAFSETDISHLSKGDVVTVSLRYGDLQQEYPDIEFKGKSYDLEVQEGLKTYTEIDPFRYVDIAFVKTSPFGEIDGENCRATDDCPDEYLPYMQLSYFKIDKTSNIAVGDVLHLTYNEDGQKLMRENGYKASQTEFDYTVQKTDLRRYVTDLAELDQAAWEGILSEANDRVRAVCGDRYGNPDAAAFSEAYLMLPKDGNLNKDTLPFIALFYKAEYTTGEGEEQQNKQAWLAVWSSCLWIEVPEEGEAEAVSFSIPDFSNVGVYDSEEEAQNREIIQNEKYKSLKIELD